MKKIRLRKWVEVVIGTIMAMRFILLGSDCEDFNIFVISHLMFLGMFILCGCLLSKYGHLNDE